MNHELDIVITAHSGNAFGNWEYFPGDTISQHFKLRSMNRYEYEPLMIALQNPISLTRYSVIYLGFRENLQSEITLEFDVEVKLSDGKSFEFIGENLEMFLRSCLLRKLIL